MRKAAISCRKFAASSLARIAHLAAITSPRSRTDASSFDVSALSSSTPHLSQKCQGIVMHADQTPGRPACATLRAAAVAGGSLAQSY